MTKQLDNLQEPVIKKPQLIEETDDEKIVRPHVYQVILALASQREIVASTGQGSGKTSWAPVLLALKMAQYPGKNFMFVEPTYGMIERLAIPNWLSFVQNTAFEGYWVSKRDKIYRNDYGTLFFMSADNAKHIQGAHVKVAIVDEGGQITREAYNIIKGRTNIEDGQTIVLTNPYRTKDPFLYTDVYKRWLAGDQNVLFLTFASIVNPMFDKKRYEHDKKVLPKELFDFQYGGKFNKPQGLIYDYDDKDVIMPVEFNKQPAFAGVDFGIGDPTVIEVGILDGDKIKIVDEYVKADVRYSAHTPAFVRLQKKYNIRIWFPDYEGVGIGAVKEIHNAALKEFGVDLNFQHAEKDVIKGVQAVSALYKEKRLIIDPKCRTLINENVSWTWGRDGKPEDRGDHAETAIRLLITGMLKYGRIKQKHGKPELQRNLNIIDRVMMELKDKIYKKGDVKNWLNLP